MISFYRDKRGVVMFKDDTYLGTMKFMIERPATDEDVAKHPKEHRLVKAVKAAPVDPEGAM